MLGAARALELRGLDKNPDREAIPMTWSAAAKHHFSRWLRTAVLCACIASTFSTRSAQAEVGKEAAESGVKGTVGGALLGAEAVIAVEAAFGVQKAWLYAVGGGLGAVGGGVGGYFVDQAGNAQVSMSLLVGGLVFAVPTTIALLSTTSYKPTQNPEVDSGVSEAARRADAVYLARLQPVPSVLDVNEKGKLKLRVPAVAIGPVWSREMREVYSLPAATQVRVPVFHLTF